MGRKIIYSFLILMVCMLLSYSSSAQCNGANISNGPINFPKQGGNTATSITFSSPCNAPNVTIHNVPSWVTINQSGSGGTYLTITCEANSGAARQAGISIRNNGSTTGGFSINQEGTGGGGGGPDPDPCVINGFPGSISFPVAGSTNDYPLTTTNCQSISDLTFRTSSGGSMPSWVTITKPQTNIIRIKISPNTGALRSVIILGTSAANGTTIGTNISQSPCLKNWYIDKDKDGFGDKNQTNILCEIPNDGNTYVEDNSDCNDDNPLINPNTVWYEDADNDGFGDPNTQITQCEQPVNYVDNDDDLCVGITGSSSGCIVNTCNGATLDPSPIDFPIQGGVMYTTISFSSPCSSINLSIDNIPSWITIQKLGNGTYFKITCEPNTDNLSRGAGVPIRNHNSIVGGFLISQDGTDGPYIDVDPNPDPNANCTVTGFPTNVTFPHGGDIYEYTLTTTDCNYAAYYYTFTHNGGEVIPSDFVTISQPEANKIRIWCKPNTGVPRSIIVSARSTKDNVFKGFTITQATPCSTEILYIDRDKDGYGDINGLLQVCEEPLECEVYVSNNQDCNDEDYLINPDTKWYLDTDNDGFGDPDSTPIVQCNQPVGYINNPNDWCVGSAGNDYGCPEQPVIIDENYILTMVPQSSQNNLLDTTDDYFIKNINYFDGLGRANQSITKQGGGSKQDIITPVVYDIYGKPAKEYLPYSNPVPGTPSLVLRDHDQLITNLNGYYATKYPEDIDVANVNPYAEKVFERSPLNRVLEQGAPGKDWLVNPNSDTDHTIKLNWRANAASEVIYFDVTFENNDTEKPQLVQSDHYTANELLVTVTKDENWRPVDGNNHTTQEYTDKQGRIILKRNYNESIPHDTYYVYDRFGNLTFVITPKVITSDGVSEIELVELCYQYKYDFKNRLIEKKIPGKGWEYIVYNTLDQPVLTQDANLRRENSGKPWDQWLFTKYDAFGRIVYTGSSINNSTRKVMQSRANSSTYQPYETRVTAPLTIAGTDVYYTKDAYPTSIYKIYTTNYYDDYNIGDLVSLNPNTTTITWEGMTATAEVKGLPTVSQVRILDTNKWITTATYYDDKGRPWETIVKNEYLGTDDYVLNKLDFVGKVLKSNAIHIKGATTITTVDTFTYDHMGRLIDQTQKINNQEEERIVSNVYDEIGQLNKKNVGGTVTPSGVEGLQTVDYAYNIRGWLKGINDVTTLGNDLFAFGINYNTATESLGATMLYNGNISETFWKTANDNTKRAYGYQYDALNRIIAGRSTSSNYNLSNVSYDKVGNIESLNRNGHLDINATSFGEMDQLIYDYDSGNKLLKVTDAANQNFGFKDGTNTNDDFEYDANGNMILDQNKGITGITYNHLNLPKTVTISNSEGTGTISYIYDATGAKLKKTAPSGGSFTTTEYAGNYSYKNGNLEFFNHPEGYVEKETDGFKYVYQFKDHLGNIRLSYSDKDNNGNIITSEIVEEKSYYPFGLQHKGYNNVISGTEHPYGFNGKEEQEELGLNWLDYGFRNYDAALGRWMNIDPLADDYYSLSPYTYTANNPVYFIDPDGKRIDISYTYQQDKDGNDVLDDDGNRIKTGVNINITGKLINFSDNDVDLVEALTDIIGSLEETFSGEYAGLEVSTTANITIAESMEDVAEDDHLFVLAEPGSKNKGNISGAANNFGGKVAFLDADYFTGWYDTNFGNTGERTASHEFGHLFNLRHTQTGLMRSGGSGTSVSSSQFGSIIRDYVNGNLNQGSNHDTNGLPNQGVLFGQGIFKTTNTKGRNKKVNKADFFKKMLQN
ncbi:DUF6443 domain-containing protein [Aquimarina aggregata]|uniref:DUF6443 domain-containing protein n=1 Tax=Aquimarina aggregata TaxID=1642818 RepID=UPI00248F770B|nr:DUF6443 domain-containing protein [Aquimarina aggregata]